MSRRIGVSDWQGGHHEAKKLIQTALPRRSASRTGLPVEIGQLERRLPSGRGDRQLGREVARLDADPRRRVEDELGRLRVARSDRVDASRAAS